LPTGEFSDRFLTKPACFGDTGTYDDADPECRACPVRAPCRNLVETKIQDAGTRPRPTWYQNPAQPPTVRTWTPSTTTPHAQQPAPTASPPESARTPPDAEMGFFSALAHNSFIQSVDSFMHEIGHAVRSIPRFRYPDPWQRKKPP
jgi:hypothetical protein